MVVTSKTVATICFCNYSLSPKGAGKPLLEGEGKVGTYKELIDAGKRGDNLTPHHMPSAEYMKKQGVPKMMVFL